MTASEAYKILRRTVGPWFKANGFKVAKSYLTYQKPVGSRWFNVRFQCNSQGWEKHKGSSFTVIMDFTDRSEIDFAPMRRLTEYLTFEQLEFIRARQNRILASIPQPPADYIKAMVVGFEKVFRDPKPYIEIYLKDWQPIAHPYKSTDDIWFRYFTEADLRAWAIVLHQHVETVYERNVAKSAA
jgi:hypothetical protein